MGLKQVLKKDEDDRNLKDEQNERDYKESKDYHKEGYPQKREGE